MTALFSEVFEEYILNKRVISWGFQHETRVILLDGHPSFPSGYYTEYENGYKMIAGASTLHKTNIQEAMILDPEGVPIARDTEGAKPYEFQK